MKTTKTSDGMGMATLFANMQDAVEMEVHVQLKYHMYHKLLKHFKYSDHKIMGKFGEECEEFMEMFTKILFFYDQTVQYEAGTITSKDPLGMPSDILVGIFEEMLADEIEIKDKFEDYTIQAMEAKSDWARNEYEHALKLVHCAHIAWLKAQLRWAKDLGNKDYAASGGRIG